MAKSKKRPPCPEDCPRKELLHREVRSHSRQIAEIRERTARVEKGLQFILNEVSANGRPGLQNSLQDIHSEVMRISKSVQAVLDATKSVRAWSDVRKAIRQIMVDSTFFALFQHRVVQFGMFFVFILFLNSILHAVGIGLDLQSILRFFRVVP